MRHLGFWCHANSAPTEVLSLLGSQYPLPFHLMIVLSAPAALSARILSVLATVLSVLATVHFPPNPLLHDKQHSSSLNRIANSATTSTTTRAFQTNHTRSLAEADDAVTLLLVGNARALRPGVIVPPPASKASAWVQAAIPVGAEGRDRFLYILSLSVCT